MATLSTRLYHCRALLRVRRAVPDDAGNGWILKVICCIDISAVQRIIIIYHYRAHCLIAARGNSNAIPLHYVFEFSAMDRISFTGDMPHAMSSRIRLIIWVYEHRYAEQYEQCVY